MNEELIFPETNEEGLLESTLIQLNKDLGISGIYLEISPLISLQQIAECLLPHINSILINKPGMVMKIIYRIDLTEKQFKKVQLMKGDYPLNLSKAIVLRAFQKIILRKKNSIK